MSSTRPQQKPEPQGRAMEELKSMARLEEKKKPVRKDKDSTSTISTSSSTYSTSSPLTPSTSSSIRSTTLTPPKAEERKRDEEPELELSNKKRKDSTLTNPNKSSSSTSKAGQRKRNEEIETTSPHKKPKAKSPLPEKFSSGKEYDANGGIPETTTSTIGERAKARAAAKERHIMAGRRTDGKGIAVKKRKSITSSDEEAESLFDQSIFDVGEAESSDDEDMTFAQPAKKPRVRAKKQVEPPAVKAAVVKPAIVEPASVKIKPTIVEPASVKIKPAISKSRQEISRPANSKAETAIQHGKPKPSSKSDVTSGMQGTKRKALDLDTTIDAKKPRITSARVLPLPKAVKQITSNAKPMTGTVADTKRRSMITPKTRILMPKKSLDAPKLSSMTLKTSTSLKAHVSSSGVAATKQAAPVPSSTDFTLVTRSSNEMDTPVSSVVEPPRHSTMHSVNTSSPPPVDGDKLEERKETQDVSLPSKKAKKVYTVDELRKEKPHLFIRKETLEASDPTSEEGSADNDASADSATQNTITWDPDVPIESIEIFATGSYSIVPPKKQRPMPMVPVYAQSAPLDPNLPQEEKPRITHQEQWKRSRPGAHRVAKEAQRRALLWQQGIRNEGTRWDFYLYGSWAWDLVE